MSSPWSTSLAATSRRAPSSAPFPNYPVGGPRPTNVDAHAPLEMRASRLTRRPEAAKSDAARFGLRDLVQILRINKADAATAASSNG